MRSLLDILSSNGFFLVVVGVASLGVLLWSLWALWAPERRRLRRLAVFLMLLGGEMYFIASFASTVAHGLRGVACTQTLYSMRLLCFNHDSSPIGFWLIVVAGSVFTLTLVFFLLVMFKDLLTRPDDGDTSVRERALRTAGVKEVPPPRTPGKFRGGLFWGGVALVVVATVAWLSMSFRHSEDVQGQVSQVLASMGTPKRAVASFQRDQHRLPKDSEEAGLPADMHIPHLSGVRILKGVIIMTFDDTDAAEPLRGRTLMLVPVALHGRPVRWHCMSMDIPGKDLPDACGSLR